MLQIPRFDTCSSDVVTDRFATIVVRQLVFVIWTNAPVHIPVKVVQYNSFQTGPSDVYVFFAQYLNITIVHSFILAVG